MRLEDNNMSGIGASGLNRAQAADGPERSTAKGAGGATLGAGADQVTLSTLTERLQGLSAQLEAAGDGSGEREAKLKALAALVESGNYEPDVDELSGKLIDSMQTDKP
jgi:anti-sigma28 factor (negative regulator of flagellin synthesis)